MCKPGRRWKREEVSMEPKEKEKRRREKRREMCDYRSKRQK